LKDFDPGNGHFAQQVVAACRVDHSWQLVQPGIVAVGYDRPADLLSGGLLSDSRRHHQQLSTVPVRVIAQGDGRPSSVRWSMSGQFGDDRGERINGIRADDDV
jgi:hypothetical protein